MKKRITALLIVLVGASVAGTFLPALWRLTGLASVRYLNNLFVDVLLGAIISFLIALFLAGLIVRLFDRIVKRAEVFVSKQSPTYLLFGSLATIVGLILANIISIPLYRINFFLFNTLAPIILMVLLGYIGFRVGTTRTDEWRRLFQLRSKKAVVETTAEQNKVLERKVGDNFHKYKILDTSVIIDGRIYEIAQTGFIEGTLLIPNFVLHELQLIADSADSLKRTRGRRGLDILNDLQKTDAMPVEMYEGDFEDLTEVDSKLIKLAKLLDGIVVTNDFNLNKVSEFQNVPVLNINELANTLKPAVIPGDGMTVTVVKAGTERQQGVAYLDDGTMIVVEDGQHYMNKSLAVTVTSALQTAAGRMIFAKPTHSQKSLREHNK
ncbi:PIN/TRAM domain-containing protein [Loigolactobacillus binensis]|uniref:PIN/TRAM domain-containing protein n=1 Tax=Loigolactobacillus binensis TaxID=2559922 RepID=A0ABW3EGY3_9LACO|nr:PIN/TRAM domain-containing protein [Loigolactobacillus binensis]